MLLVVWAMSFGLNERGAVEGEEESPPSTDSHGPGPKRSHRKTRTEALLHEIMEQIDYHGVLRRPTLDGVRVLLLLLPLLEGKRSVCRLRSQNSLTYLEAQPLERLAIYEATLSQVQALCVLSASTSPGFEDAAIRARIFWYAYTQEGITTGIRGGRFVLYVHPSLDMIFMAFIRAYTFYFIIGTMRIWIHFKEPCRPQTLVLGLQLFHLPHRLLQAQI